MTDLPDWTTQQQAGGIRYIGSVSVTIGGGGSGGGSLNVSLLPLDRSIIVVCPGRGAITTTTVSVLTNDPGVSPALFSTSAGVSADPQPVNAYVSPAITSLWQVAVDMTGPPSGPFVFYVFVDSSVTHVAVDPGAASIPVGITSPPLGGTNSLNSLPVVIASDQSAVATRPQSSLAGRIVATYNNVTPGSAGITLGTIPAQGTSSLYRLVRAHHSASCRGTVGANVAVSALSLIDAHGGSVQLTYLMVQPGAPQHAEVTWPTPLDVGHFLNTGDVWSLIEGSALVVGTPGNLDGIGVLEWEHQ